MILLVSYRIVRHATVMSGHIHRMASCYVRVVTGIRGRVMPVKEGYFDSKRDRAIIEAGGFFCLGCLMGKPASEQSPDPRYCPGCFKFLSKEAEMLTSTGQRTASWKPVTARRGAGSSSGKALPVGDKGCDTAQHKELQGANGVTTYIAARIRELGAQGMSCRGIEKELLKDGIVISYRTVARKLQGVLL